LEIEGIEKLCFAENAKPQDNTFCKILSPYMAFISHITVFIIYGITVMVISINLDYRNGIV